MGSAFIRKIIKWWPWIYSWRIETLECQDSSQHFPLSLLKKSLNSFGFEDFSEYGCGLNGLEKWGCYNHNLNLFPCQTTFLFLTGSETNQALFTHMSRMNKTSLTIRYIQFSATISLIFDLQTSCSKICSAWTRSIDSLPHCSLPLYFSTYECLYLSCFKFPLCTSFIKMVSAIIIDWLRGIRMT